MVNLTKQAITESFIRLLEEKPLSQITIKEIVDDCKLNRNTFYYYFRGIPHLLESVINEDAEELIRRYPKIESLEECTDAVIHSALEHKRAVLHIYHSVNRDLYEQYQWRICEHVVTLYLDGVLEGRRVSESDRRLIIDYMKCLAFGFIMSWLEGGMSDDILGRFHRLFVLKNGDLERFIANSEQQE